uniref:Uncharacterized protein n=1 Tax=Panagrolaimus sp. PS1159 TaxID=55785 RepID=A0AC35F4V8_9BILA
MNFFKLLLIFALLLFGSFGQRFLRHSNNDDALFGKDSDDNLLSSDGSIAQEVRGDVRLTGYAEEIELELDELKFEYCSQRIRQNKQRCMDQTVFACYDAKNPSEDTSSQYKCRPNQCSFEAGISKASSGLQTPFVWFMDSTTSTAKILNENEDICPTAIMRSPTAAVTLLQQSFSSCEPLITNGKIKLSVKIATTECFLTVKNAKIWSPTTTRHPTTPSTLTSAEGSKEETSNSTLIWAIVGGIIFILLIAVIALAVWYFCIRKQSKDVDKKKINGEAFHETPIT